MYVAGYEKNEQGNKVAKLWKNGVAQNLTDGNYGAQAKSVYVSGSNMYIVGYEGNNDCEYPTPMFWKNGVVQKFFVPDNNEDYNLEDVCSMPQSVYISGNDAYVAGGSSGAILWKNGITQELESDGKWCGAFSIYVQGKDVYVAGGEHRAKIWKNGEVQYLTTSDNSPAAARSVYVFGGVVYVAGYQGKVAKFWKNGVAYNLTNGTYAAGAYCVFVK